MKPTLSILAAALSAAAFSTHAAPPAVQGPESVQDWFNAGKAFVAASKQAEPIRHRAKNVILIVGDGMGVSTVTGARILEGQMAGKPGEENRLSFETMPYLALSKTYSWDQQTSDSAPTMTAMVTGYKTRESMLSVNHLTMRNDCSAANVSANRVKTLLEKAAENGKATGVISTARLTHATPAATYAHTPMRDWEADSNQPANCGVKDIARQLLEVSPKVRKSLAVAMGGGRTYFLPKVKNGANFFDPEYPTMQGRRNDGRDLTQEWVGTRGVGAQYVWNRAQFDAVDPATTPFLLGLFEPSHMQYEADRAQDTAGEPSLTEMTDKAIRMLSRQPNGYFLHIEAGRIDHGHHAGNAKRALLDTIELSRAVKRAMELTSEQDTLIIVTADHSHTMTIGGYPHRGNSLTGLVREVPGTDGDPVVDALDRNGLPYATLSYANGPGHRSGGRPDLRLIDTSALDFLQEATVPLSSETHAGEDVPIYARGPRAHLVHGSMEQNWIYHVMRNAFDF